MKVCDLPIEDLKVGLRLMNVAGDRIGTIVDIKPEDDYWFWIQWDGDDGDDMYSGAYFDHCILKLAE